MRSLQVEVLDQGLILRQMKQSRTERLRQIENMTHGLHRKHQKDRQLQVINHFLFCDPHFQVIRKEARKVTRTKGQEINPLELWFPKFIMRFSQNEKEKTFKKELRILKLIKPPYLDEKLTRKFIHFCHKMPRYLLQDPDAIGALYFLSNILKIKDDFISLIKK